MEWFDAISRTLRWNTRAADQKGWLGNTRQPQDEDEDEREGATRDGEPEFDIDFEDDEAERKSVGDSGYSGASSTA